MKHLFIAALILLMTGCATSSQSRFALKGDTNDYAKPSALDTPRPDLADSKTIDVTSKRDAGRSEHMQAKLIHVTRDKEPQGFNASLLKSDEVTLSEQALNKILSSRVVLPSKGHLAIIRYPGAQRSDASFGKDYSSSEAYLKTQQDYIVTLSEGIAKSDRIVAVTFLPSLLTPADASIPLLREAAVRIQADLLLAFRITSDIYEEYEDPVNNRIKAFSICEAVLMDIRTGLIPYTTVATGENMQELISDDSEINDVKDQAENEAVLTSLKVVAREITEFLRSVP